MGINPDVVGLFGFCELLVIRESRVEAPCPADPVGEVPIVRLAVDVSGEDEIGLTFADFVEESRVARPAADHGVGRGFVVKDKPGRACCCTQAAACLPEFVAEPGALWAGIKRNRGNDDLSG